MHTITTIIINNKQQQTKSTKLEKKLEKEKERQKQKAQFLRLRGEIRIKGNQNNLACDDFKTAFDGNNLLWSCFRHICEYGDNRVCILHCKK